MTIASEITKSQTNLANSYTACQNKGATMPVAQNFDNLATCIGSITGGTSGKYQLLDRVKDDSNNEIGTVSGFFTDANDVEYAVVCLDAQYRATGVWCSSSTGVTNLPKYASWAMWEAKETATSNTGLILSYCTANNYTSSACTHCRSKSFVIDGVTYYGQMPNTLELCDICKHYTYLNSHDTSLSQYSSYRLGLTGSSDRVWASSQTNNSQAWTVYGSSGGIASSGKTGTYLTVPVLEIPNAI